MLRAAFIICNVSHCDPHLPLVDRIVLAASAASVTSVPLASAEPLIGSAVACMYACMHAGLDHHHDSEALLQLGGLDPRVSPDEFTRQLVLQHALKLQQGPRREVLFSSLLVDE